jgi:Fe-S oxidoreductase
LAERLAGFSALRDLPVWRRDRFDAPGHSFGPEDGHEVVLWADTFNAAFEPDILRDAIKLMTVSGYRVHVAAPADGSRRPLCCGRTYLAAGDVARAKAEMSRTLAALDPYFARGVALVGLEPSCLFSFRDEALAMLPGPAAKRAAAHAMLLEEFLVREAKEGRFQPAFAPASQKVLLHGHCHQKAFGTMGAVEAALKMVPGLAVEKIESSCCGMAGAFGYQAETVAVSLAMGELSLLPAARAAAPDTMLVADGTSCRHQIESGAGRKALHVVSVLAEQLADRGRSGRTYRQ